MLKTTKLASAVSYAVLAASSAMVFNSFAQSTNDGNGAIEKEIDRIQVTGSRIARVGFDSVQPIAVVTGEEMKSLGYTNVADALNNMPAFGVPGSSGEGTQGGQGVGQSFVNFYGLGSQRTLTLVNGRRFVSSNPLAGGNAGDGLQVDLNMIPMAMVERIETVGVGGAPIYGSDAIAGTVNIILKKDFEGLAISTNSGISSRDDLEEHRVSIVAGGNFADDKGNAIFSVEYSTKKGILASGRDHRKAGWQFREPCSGGKPAANAAGESIYTESDCQYQRVLTRNAHANLVAAGGLITNTSSAVPNVGVGALNDGNFYKFNPDGSLGLYDIGLPTGNAVWSAGGEGIFLPDVENLFSPLDRVLVNSIVSYELTDNVRAFSEFFFGNSKASELANQPAYQSGLFGAEDGSLLFDINNPFLSAESRQKMQSLGITDSFYLQRASTDLSNNNNRVDNEGHLYRFVAGLEGQFEIAGRHFDWDVSYNIGKSDSISQATTILNENFFYALDAVRAADGSIQCRVKIDKDARPTDPANKFNISQGTDKYDQCVALNLFGQGAPSADAINYISGMVTAKSELQQEVLSASTSGGLYELPAGELAVALGINKRTETASFSPDISYQKDLTRAGQLSAIEGGFTVKEAFAEFFVPLVSDEMDIPFVHKATIETAFRTMDNSFAGRDNAWTVGVTYAPVEDIEFRFNRTRSVRAPSITELFQPVVKGNSFASDPCDARFNTADTAKQALREKNCAADGIDRQNFSSTAANASVQGRSGGNPNLDNEVANSYSVGAIIKPRWVPDLTVAVDYINIELEDAIQSFSLTQIMQACYDSENFPNEFCGKFQRDPNTKQLLKTDAYESGYVNAGDRIFRAMSIDAQYKAPMPEAWGELTLGAYVMLPQEQTIITLGTPNYNIDEPGNAEIKANLTARWSLDDLTVTLQPRYVSEMVINNDDFREAKGNNKISRNVLDLESQWRVDLGISYQLLDNVAVQFNVANLFDKLPPVAAVASGDTNVYDNRGRYFRAGLNINF